MNYICFGLFSYRFPHLDFQPEQHQFNPDSSPICILPNLYIGDFNAGLATKKLLALGITHILNVTATEYTKRTKYFKYLTIDVYDKSDEDIKKHFRITNRFIHDVSKKKRGEESEGERMPLNFPLECLLNFQLEMPLKLSIRILFYCSIQTK